MADSNSTVPKTLGDAIYDLYDTAALIEAVEAQLEHDDDKNPIVRVLRIAHDKLIGAIACVDSVDTNISHQVLNA